MINIAIGGLITRLQSNRWVEDSDYLDAAIKYKVSKSVSILLKALNLLEEAQVKYLYFSENIIEKRLENITNTLCF